MNNIFTINFHFTLKMMEVTREVFNAQEFKSSKQNDSDLNVRIKKEVSMYVKEARKQLTPEQTEMTVFSDFSGNDVYDVMSHSVRPVGKKGKFIAVCMMGKPKHEYDFVPSIIVSGTTFPNKKIDQIKIWSECADCMAVEDSSEENIKRIFSHI